MVLFEPHFPVHNIFVDSAHSPLGDFIAKLRRNDHFRRRSCSCLPSAEEPRLIDESCAESILKSANKTVISRNLPASQDVPGTISLSSLCLDAWRIHPHPEMYLQNMERRRGRENKKGENSEWIWHCLSFIDVYWLSTFCGCQESLIENRFTNASCALFARLPGRQRRCLPRISSDQRLTSKGQGTNLGRSNDCDLERLRKVGKS